MSLPLFYQEIFPGTPEFSLSEETSKHIIQVLRMKEGDQLRLTNGKGQTKTVEITDAHKRASKVKELSSFNSQHRHPEAQRGTPSDITIAISPIKSASRFEWFLEKATEIGVSAIIPLICQRTEKQHFRHDRMKSILISAMLQSQQAWLPELSEPVKFSKLVENVKQEGKYIAHCLEDNKQQLNDSTTQHSSKIILIGPEGDFTKEEIELATANNFIPVSLGETRLRTETAGIVAAVLLR